MLRNLHTHGNLIFIGNNLGINFGRAGMNQMYQIEKILIVYKMMEHRHYYHQK